MINKKIKQSTWIYTVDSADIINLYIKLLDKQIHIHNIYTLVNIEEISTSISILKQKFAKNLHKKHITLSNFILQYKLWGGLDTSKTYIKKSEELLITMQR